MLREELHERSVTLKLQKVLEHERDLSPKLYPLAARQIDIALDTTEAEAEAEGAQDNVPSSEQQSSLSP